MRDTIKSLVLTSLLTIPLDGNATSPLPLFNAEQINKKVKGFI